MTLTELAAMCAPSVAGRAFDLTLLDCGKPVVGDESVLCAGKWSELSINPVYDEADDIDEEDQLGRKCVFIPGCGYLQQVDITGTLCGLNNNVAWLTGDRTVAATGGAVFGQRDECPPWFSMRIWQDLAIGGGRKVCADSGDDVYRVWHLACVTDFRLSDAMSFNQGESTKHSFTATAYVNGGFYENGPYNSWVDPWDDNEIFGYQLETTAPPEAACELKPYVAPPPLPPAPGPNGELDVGGDSGDSGEDPPDLGSPPPAGNRRGGSSTTKKKDS